MLIENMNLGLGTSSEIPKEELWYVVMEVGNRYPLNARMTPNELRFSCRPGSCRRGLDRGCRPEPELQQSAIVNGITANRLCASLKLYLESMTDGCWLAG